jgi:hypothetical protein
LGLVVLVVQRPRKKITEATPCCLVLLL